MIDIETRWSLSDVYDAHELLSLYDRIEERQAARMQEEAKAEHQH